MLRSSCVHRSAPGFVYLCCVATLPGQSAIYTPQVRRTFPRLSTGVKLVRINTAAHAFFPSTDGDNRLAHYMPRATTISDIAERFAALSRREQQVVNLACDGLSNRMIAEKLGVNEGTVKSHLHAIYDKLGVQSRIALMIALSDRSTSKPD